MEKLKDQITNQIYVTIKVINKGGLLCEKKKTRKKVDNNDNANSNSNSKS